MQPPKGTVGAPQVEAGSYHWASADCSAAGVRARSGPDPLRELEHLAFEPEDGRLFVRHD